MLECNLSGHRVLSPSEAYHKRPLEGADLPRVSPSSKTTQTCPRGASTHFCHLSDMYPKLSALAGRPVVNPLQGSAHER